VTVPTIAPAGTVRLGFIGVGWIGLHRLRALAETGLPEVTVVSDPSDEAIKRITEIAPRVVRAEDIESLLEHELDGVVIATPNAMHAEQAIATLERGVAVFCQKPLARTEQETRRVIAAARARDRLLRVDLSYRHTAGMRRIHELVQSGALGTIHAAELVFHNAYGPDKPWFLDIESSGGGCVLDLGVHLVDLLVWLLGRRIERVSSRLYAKGELLPPAPRQVEDFAVVQLDLKGGATATLQCSWHAHAGRDAVIGVALHGSEGGASWQNVNGSFYDFEAARFRGTTSEALAGPPDDWGGRAAVAWLRDLADGGRYDPGIESVGDVAATLDAIYGRSGS
jgi:predicted dehydrogenase